MYRQICIKGKIFRQNTSTITGETHMYPSSNNSDVLIDGKTQRIINPQTGQCFPQPPHTPPAYRKGKSGEQVDIFLQHFWYSVFTYGYTQLRITEMGTKYLYRHHEFAFFESDRFEDRLKAFAHQVGMSDVTDTAVKSLKSILREDHRYWVWDQKDCGNGSVRIIHHDSTVYYLLDMNNFICLNLYKNQQNSNTTNEPVAFLYSNKSAKLANFVEIEI